MNDDMRSFIEETILNNNLVKINDQLYLKKYQIDILDIYHIEYKNCSSISEILFLIDEFLEDSDGDSEELEEVADSLQEFNYYHNTNK